MLHGYWRTPEMSKVNPKDKGKQKHDKCTVTITVDKSQKTSTTSLKMIADISKKYMKKVASKKAEPPKPSKSDMDKCYDADVESQSDGENTKRQKKSFARRKRQEKKVIPPVRTEAAEQQNKNNNRALGQTAISECLTKEAVVVLTHINTEYHETLSLNSSISSRTRSHGNLRTTDVHIAPAVVPTPPVSIRNVDNSDSVSENIGVRSVNKRRVDRNKTDQLLNKSAGDSGVFLSPRSPTQKRLKIMSGVTTSTPCPEDTSIAQVFPSDASMIDYSSVCSQDSLLTDGASSVNDAQSAMSTSQTPHGEHENLFPTYVKKRTNKKNSRKKKENLTDIDMYQKLNVEFSEIENFELIIE